MGPLQARRATCGASHRTRGADRGRGGRAAHPETRALCPTRRASGPAGPAVGPLARASAAEIYAAKGRVLRLDLGGGRQAPRGAWRDPQRAPPDLRGGRLRPGGRAATFGAGLRTRRFHAWPRRSGRAALGVDGGVSGSRRSTRPDAARPSGRAVTDPGRDPEPSGPAFYTALCAAAGPGPGGAGGRPGTKTSGRTRGPGDAEADEVAPARWRPKRAAEQQRSGASTQEQPRNTRAAPSIADSSVP